MCKKEDIKFVGHWRINLRPEVSLNAYKTRCDLNDLGTFFSLQDTLVSTYVCTMRNNLHE